MFISCCIFSRFVARLGPTLIADRVLAPCSLAATKLGIAARCGGAGGYFGKVGVSTVVLSWLADLWID